MGRPSFSAATRRSSLSRLYRRPDLVLLAGLIAAVCAFQLYRPPGNPPGFHRDEASLAYNAWTISRNLRDQDGGFAPLYLVSYKDYKSTLFVYVLAGVFRLVPPSIGAARELGAALVLLAILALGLLAYRRTQSFVVAAAIVLLGGTTPWLYELGRTAFEATMLPLTIVTLLLAVEWSWRSTRPLLIRALPVALAFGAVTYVYAAGRLLAPLYAAALVVFARRGTWRWILSLWGVCALTLVPIALYSHDHPGALTARYQSTTFVQDQMTALEILRRGAWNYLQDVSLWHWIISGDPKPYIHTWGAGQLFASVVALAAVGVVHVVRQRPFDRWWGFVIACTLLSPIPAALTVDRHHALRMLPIPVFLLVLAVPGVALIARLAQRTDRVGWTARVAAILLVCGAALQFAWFEQTYQSKGPDRTLFYEAAVPDLLAHAFEDSQVIYTDFDDRYAQTHALWYAVTHNVSRSRVSILPDGGIPPTGTLLFGRTQPCDFACTRVAEAGEYWLARVDGPPPG